MIGILGGTFDPIHNGHVQTALDVQQCLSLDEIRFIPCGEPPHRQAPLASPLQRLSMVRAAIAGQEKFVADDREIRRQGQSYMLDTLISLKQDFKNETFCLLLGSDAFRGLEQWYQWNKIFDFANIVIMQRPETGGDIKLSDTFYSKIKHRFVGVDKFKEKRNGGICFVPVTQIDISSTYIRQQWYQNNDIQFLLPEPVLTLIQQQNIY